VHTLCAFWFFQVNFVDFDNYADPDCPECSLLNWANIYVSKELKVPAFSRQVRDAIGCTDTSDVRHFGPNAKVSQIFSLVPKCLVDTSAPVPKCLGSEVSVHLRLWRSGQSCQFFSALQSDRRYEHITLCFAVYGSWLVFSDQRLKGFPCSLA